MTRACRIGVMKRSMRVHPWLIAAMAMGLPAALPAQDQDKDELTWYEIEVIVFERSSEIGRNAEFWAAEPGLPDIASAVELSVEGLAPADATDDVPAGGEIEAPPQAEDLTSPDTSMPLPFQLVAPGDYRLTDARERLEKSSAFRPLLHVAWIQPGFPSEQARLVHVRNNNSALGAVAVSVDESQPALSEPDYAPTLSSRISVARDPSKPALDGTLRVHRARYLHVQADLLYYRPLDTDARAAVPANDNADATLMADSPDTAFIEQLLAEEDSAPRLFRLSESRRMRSRELHYLDHPLFGMIVEAWPVELPEPPAAPDEGALPGDGDVTKEESGVVQPVPLLPAPTQSGSGG
jgi:hypothetical protein